jgi:energy-coupling factor transporter ATP-binding protein EcfA2
MAVFHDKIADFKTDMAYLNLILGITGSGKSTLFNYLNGLPLIIQEGYNGTIELDVDQKALTKDQAFALIGHSFVSKTSIPNFSKPPK